MIALDNASITSAAVLERMNVPGDDGKYEGVYVLGCMEKRLTFHSQQQRAYNLIWALFAQGKLREGQKVAVVGGGLAGLTAAVAAFLKKCKVTLLEERERLLHLQWGNGTRHVHPNLYDWPRTRSEHPMTDLPDLNWEAGPAGDVARQVRDRWEDAFKGKSDLEVVRNCAIDFIVQEAGQIRISSARKRDNTNYTGRFDCVILAVGFGVEKNLSPRCAAHSYWEQDALDQPVKSGPTPRRYLVTGCGDGGLVDILRLRIKDFSHENLLTALLIELVPPRVKDQLIEIDRLANEKLALAASETDEQRRAARMESGLFLEEEYTRLRSDLFLSAIQWDTIELREDTEVVLNGPSNSYLDLGASILGRFTVFVLKEVRRDPGLKYWPGKIDPDWIEQLNPQGHPPYIVEVKDGSETAPWKDEFDQIVVRHGADASLKRSFPEIFERCRASLRTGEDPTRQKLYPEDFFPQGPRLEAGRTRSDRRRRPGAIPNNLPKKTDDLIGRDAEIEHVKRTLEHHRLLTLTGSGGCGKTSLAKESARLLLAERAFPDGIRVVGLGNLTDAGQVAFSVATVFGVKEAIGGSLIEALVAAIGKDRILLVLDNCEHVIDACSDLVLTLLESCLDLRILATSRQPLKLSPDKQNEYKVRALSLPPDRQSGKRVQMDDLQVIEGSKAVQLFVDRARSVKPEFALTVENARLVEKICRRLDGIPGAIVLAAARVYEFGLRDISKLLEKSFEILRQEAQDKLPHQQTIDKTVEWSYKLLKEDERQFFLRLAVFEGGWDAASAEAICWGGHIPQDAVRNLLGGLVKKSLVEAEVLAGDGRRYRLLQTTRDFILRRPEGCPSVPLRRRHLDHFLELAEKSEPRLGGIADPVVLNLTNVEYANIIAALSWEPEALEDKSRRLKLAGAMGRYWETRGYLSEGRRWLELALAQADASSTESRARALLWAGVLAFRQGDYATSRQQLEESLRLWDELKNPHGKATVLQRLGKVVRDEGDYSTSQSHYEQSLQIWRELGDAAGTAASLAGLGVVYSDMAYEDERHYAQSRSYFKEALRIARGLSDRYRMAPPLNNLGIIERNLGNLDEALQLHLECLNLMKSTQDKAHISLVYYNLGIVYWLRQDLRTAADNHRQSLEISKSLGDKRGIALALEGLARVWQSRGQSDRAARIFAAANAIREVINCPMEPNERKHYEASLGEAEKQLGAEASQAGQDEGSRMSPESAIEFALEGLMTDAAPSSE